MADQPTTFPFRALGPVPAMLVDSDFYLVGHAGTVAQADVQILPDPVLHPAILQDKGYAVTAEWCHWKDNTSPQGVSFADNATKFVGVWDGGAWNSGGLGGSSDVANANGGAVLQVTATTDPFLNLTLGGDPGKTNVMNYIWRVRVIVFDDAGIPVLP